MALHIDTGRDTLPKVSNRHDASQNQRGHPQSSSIPPPLPPLRQPIESNDKNATALRKYLVLLQDCLAIKFSPIVSDHHHHPHQECPSSPDDVENEDDDDYLPSHGSPRIIVSNGGSTAKRSSNSIFNEHHSDTSRPHQHQHHQLHNCTRGNVSFNNDEEDNNGRRYLPLQSRPLSVNFNGASYNPSSSTSSCKNTEVDHSLQALFLYKGFKEANAQCTWNPALTATFQNIQYKGYIVPYTILVGSSVPKFLSILRTAWSRQMLKSPKGYRIEFIGEIEEVIADPIQKGQFAPLSDALCWVILELTSLGQEAFVDSIISTLQLSFPTMSCPSRELVFQTLENLIKERKVYQTSRGYFVVTPEIFRYMVSANFHEADWTSAKPMGGEMTLDALLHPNSQGADKSSFSNPSWEAAAGECDHDHHHHRCASTPSDDELLVGRVANQPNSSPKLKRHNSLKLIRQRDAAVVNGSTPRRYSFRLPKSKSCGRMNDEDSAEEVVKRASKGKSSTMGHISRAMRSLRYGSVTPESGGNCEEGNTEGKGKKHKSLLSKFFPFRRRSSSKNRSSEKPSSSSASLPDQHQQSASGSASMSKSSSSSSASEDGSKSPPSHMPPTKTKHAGNSSANKNRLSAKLISTQTQTSHSTEQLCVPSISIPGSGEASNKKTSGRMMMTADAHSSLSPEQDLPKRDVNLMRPEGGSHSHHHTRSSSRRSMSILDESPLYDVLQDEVSPSSRKVSSQLSPNFQVGCPVAPSILSSGYHQNHRVPSRCSTLSSQAVSSLGYGSNGHPSLNSNCNCNSANMNGGSSPGDGHYDYAHSPTKRNQYSSSTPSYKNSYEWWRKRYPNYVSPLGRSSPLYASLTAPRSKSRSRPTYESLLTPAATATVSPQVRNNNIPPDNSNVTTSTITQAVKSTTNMEMQLLLPLGKIMTAALQAKKDAIKDAWLRDELGPGYAAYANKNKENANFKQDHDPDQPIQITLDSTSGAKLRVGEPTTKTEITTVVNNNGLIETKFDMNSDPLPPNFNGISSTLEITTLGGLSDIVMVNGKNDNEKRASNSNFPSNKELIKAC